MAKEASVAPRERVNITYKPATGDAKAEVELPLKMLMIGDYTLRPDERPLEERKRTRLLLGAIEKSDQRYAQAESVLKDGLVLPASPEQDAKLLYVLAKMYVAWGRPDQARRALQKVVSSYGQTAIAQKARESLGALDK